MTDRRAERLALDIVQLPTSIALTAEHAQTLTSSPAAGLGSYQSWAADTASVDQRQEALHALLVHAGAGVHPADYDLYRAKPEAIGKLGMFHATLRMWGRRTAIRYAPLAKTPFMIARVTDGRVGVWFEGDRIATGDIMEPEATCLRNLSYYSDGRARDVDPAFTINPIQSCALRCKFCRRQYDSLGRDSDPLMNLPPAAMAQHLVAKYPRCDWSSRVRIALVTGTFADFPHLQEWLSGFTRAMFRETGGEWDPSGNEGQHIHVLSHLARTRRQMQALRELGVKGYQDTAEIVNDDRRAALMPKANPSNRRLVGKGEIAWRRVLGAVADGIDTFGDLNYAVTLILGLDSKEDTLRGMNQLLSEGLVMLDRPVYQAFEEPGLDLYAMSAAELAEVTVAGSRLFRRMSTDWNADAFVVEERRLSRR